MNICITPESIKLFSAYFKKEIPNHFTNEISANALLNKLFDKAISDFKNMGLTEERTRELILQHLSVAPQIIKKYIGENPSANNPKLLDSVNLLSGIIYDASQSDNKSDFQNAINSLGQIIGKSTLVIPAAPVGNDFNAVSFELLKTANQEMIYEPGVGYRNNITDPEKQFEFEVQRAIIASGNADNLQLKLVQQSELKNINQINNTNKDTNPDTYVLVPVDSSGKIVRFVDGKVNEDGSTPVFVLRQTMKEFDYLLKEKSDIYISQGMSPAQAFAKARQEIQGHLEFIANLKKDHAAGKTVNFSISLANSLMGLVVEKLDRKTSMRSITNIDEVPIHIKRKGTQTIAVMHVPLSGRQVLPNEKPMYENSMMDVTDEELDILTKLITEPKLKKSGIKRKTGESYMSDMRFEERQNAVYFFHRNAEEFIFYQKKEFDKLTKKTKQSYFIRIKNEVIEATAENAEQIKQALKTYFTTRSSELYAYSTDFTNVTPKESFEKTTDVGQVFYGEDGRVYITTGPKRNLNILNETDVESMINVPTSVVDGVVTLVSKSIRNHIIDNTKTTIITNGNNELRGYSSYLALGYTAEDASEAMIDDSVEPLFRTLAETNLETEPTEKQKEDAMTWFKNHPLFKVLSLNETLRNKIHEKGPSFVAEFVNSSINLYLGSNNTDIYHEAFHAFTQSILTSQERKAMYSEIAKTPGTFKVTVLGKAKTVKFSEANELEIEEYLAEKFREYSMNRGKSKLSVRIKQFFDKVLNMLQGMFGKNMTYNEAIALNKSAGVVNNMFNALYEGNIDISKFNPEATKTALYKSTEINFPDVDFSIEQISVLMESMQSLMSDFINLGINGSSNRKVNTLVVNLLLESSQVKVDSKRHKKIFEEIDKLNKSHGVVNGYGAFAIAKNPKILELALTYVKNRLEQQKKLMKPLSKDDDGFALDTLTKALKAFGDVTEPKLYLDEAENSNLISLYLNNYSNINVQQETLDYFDSLDDVERGIKFTFGLTGTEQSLAEVTDEQTREMLSTIHAHANNGKGAILVNSLGIKKVQPFIQMLAKTSKILRNTTDRVEMYNKLMAAAKTDYEIAQIVNKLGNINNPEITTEEQKAWLNFWQVMNKTDLFLREFIIEKVVDTDRKTKEKTATLEARSGRSKSAESRVGKDWADNFVFVSHNSPYFSETKDGEAYLKFDKDSQKYDLVEDYEEKGFGLISGTEDSPEFITSLDERINKTDVYTGKLFKASANPFEFLNHIGIDLVQDPVVLDILLNGHAGLDIQTGIVDNIMKSLMNRQTAVNENNKKVTELSQLFSDFEYINANGEKVKQEGLNGWFNQLQKLQYMFSDENSSSMGKNAEGENQSEKSYNSSLSMMVTALNDAKHYDEILEGSGLEIFNVKTNPFAAASPWLVNMFNLESPNAAVRGTRNKNFKITVESLSGSKIIYQSEDKGVSTLGLDEKAKFLSDFHLTLEGKQEILRTADKSTSLTAHAPVNKNGRIIKNELEVTKEDINKIFSPEYDANKNSTILYDQFFRHIEAELVRISRMNDITEDLESEGEIVFDAAYLKRGRDFYMFANILTPATKKALLELKISDSQSADINNTRVLNKLISAEFKKVIDKEIKAYFEKRSDGLFNRKNKSLVIAGSALKTFQKNSEEEEDVTRKRMFRTFTINNFIQNANFATLFIGDAAIHDVRGEGYHKRIAGLISTGKIFANDSAFLAHVNNPNFNAFGFAEKHNNAITGRTYNGYINSAVIKEKKSVSAYLQQYSELIDAKDYGAENKMKEADGAGWISFDMYRILNLACGEWSDQQETLYNKMLAGEKISEEDAKITFPVRKFQYYGQVNNKDATYNLQMMAFHKYSLMPLIPSLIKGTPLQDLHESMLKQGVDYVTMESGSKLSSISKVEMKDGKVVSKFDDFYDDERKTNDIEFTVNQIHSKYLKNQIYLAPGYKNHITLPTQKRKMIALGLFNDEQIPTDFKPNLSKDERKIKWESLKTDSKKRAASKNYDWYKRYEVVISKIQAHLKQELIDDLGLSYGADGSLSGSPEKLVAYLEKQMKSNDMLADDIEYITSVSVNAETLDFSLSMYSEKIEAILMTLADKKLRALNVNGEALVQVPGTMFENKKRAEEFAKIEKPTLKDIHEYGSNGLSFYHVTDKNGDPVLTKDTNSWIVKSMEVKISLQGDFKKLLYLKHPDGKKIAVYSKDAEGKNILDYDESLARLNESIKNTEWKTKYSKFLEIAGDRIPSQGPNALESITVAEFLPEWAGPIIILPAEIVAKAGSDYDIDKLFTQFPNIVKIGNKIELQQYRSDVTKSLKELYAEKSFIVDELKDVRSEIDALYEQRTNFFEASDDIATEVKNQIKEQYNLDKDLYKTRSELTGFLKAAENGLWKFKNIPIKQRAKYIAQYEEQMDAVNELIDFQEEQLKKILFEELGVEKASDFFKYSDDLIKSQKQKQTELQNELEEIQRKIYGKSIKGLENELLSLFAEKILMPASIKDLITTNSTDIALPVAQQLEEIIRKRDSETRFNKYDRITDENGDGISPTTLFDYEYNLLKHQENSVGKDSLGIAAVTATYYAMFQTFGAKLNAVSQKEQTDFDEAMVVVSKVADINYQVEQIKEANKDNITPEIQKQISSLLKLLPRADKIETANSTVNRFKNYTFKLNHNKLKSELGEHIALGIINNTKGQSISDLISQMINGYVDVAKDAWVFNMQGNKQNTPTLLFMIMAGVSLESAAYLSSTPLVMEYNQIKKELSGVYANLGLDPEMSPIVETQRINKKAQEKLFENHEQEFKANGLETFNYNSIANKNASEFTESELLGLVKQKAIDMRQIQALAEYIHIEKIASDVSKFQQLTRFDTNKIATISEAQKRKEDILEFISRKTYVPQSWFSAEGIGNTPVGQFNNDEFLVNLFERYFSLRDNPALVKTSLDKVIKDNKPKTVVDVVMRTDFKNDFIWFLYQNSLFKKNTYDGYTFKVLSDPKAEFSINEETKVVTFSSNILGNDINNPKLGLSHMMHNFPTADQYVRFKIELSKLENEDAYKLRKEYYFLDNAKNKVTDLWLKNKIALYKSRNQIAYFYGPTSVGNMFKRFKQEHPDLAKKYAIIRDMKFSNDKKTYKSNMYLPDISDVNLRKQYKENLADLKNDIARPEIAEFFGLFNNIAMMQTGVNRRSQYDLGKIIDADHLHNVIDNGIGIGKIINELNQINDNIEAARIHNLNKDNAPMIPDLQLLDQFKELFIGMMESSYKTRVRGYNYEVQNLNFGKHKELGETISSFNNVVVLNSLVGAPKDRLALTASLFFDEDGEYTPEEFAESIKDEKIAILNKKLVAPAGEDQAKLDKLLLDYLGINNSGNFPILEYKSKTVKEGFLSIAGLGLKLMPEHSVKDEAMANASTVAIGQATIVNPNAMSSSQNYVDELTAKYPGKLADSKTKFKSTDKVWVFGSGVFASRIKNVTVEEFDIALNKTFDTYHKPAINKAIKAGVKTFNVGTASGIDKMASDYLESQGYIKVPMYAPIGKYYEMRKSDSSFEDLNYDNNAVVVNKDTLEAGDLMSFLFNDNKANNWYTNLSEKQKFEKGVSVVYDKIVNQLNKNTMYKIQFGNRLVAQKGQIKIGDSPLSAAIEQALYKMRNDIINHRQSKSVAAPVVNQPLSFDMEIGSFVKYQGSTYIITQFNDNGTVQIYNPTLEGASAKIPVAKRNLEVLSSKAKIVNYKDTDYIVTPKGTIISLTSNKAMNWAENDGNRVAILEKAKARSNQSFASVKVIATSIPQNRISGIESMGSTQQAAANVKQVLGSSPHSIDMIDADFRTRTTRSVGEMQKYQVKVGDIVIQSGKSSNGLIKNIFTKITAIHPKGTPGYLGTWNKEGWSQEGITEIERYKNGAAAIEFEVIRYTGTMPIKEFLSLPLEKQTVIIEQQLKC